MPSTVLKHLTALAFDGGQHMTSIVPQNQLPLFEETPLPELIAEQYGFPLAYRDVDGKRVYAVRDWIIGVAQTPDPGDYWKKMKRRAKTNGVTWGDTVSPHPYTDAQGKTIAVDHATAEGLYFITGKMDADTGLRDEILKYLAKAGVVVDNARIQQIKDRKQIPARQTKTYRRLIDSGYTDQKALQHMDMRQYGKEKFRMISGVWYKRGGDIGKLADRSTYRATGKHSWEWKREWNISVSPREYFSTDLLAILAMLEEMAAKFSEYNDSKGTDALARDLDRTMDYVNFEAIKRDYPSMFVKRPISKGEQRKLLRDGNE